MPEPAALDLQLEPDLERTVVARLTAPGHAALATIGIAGPRANTIAQQLFTGRWNPQRPMYGYFGATVQDDVVLNVCKADGYEWVEFHCHGGQAIVTALLETIQSEGATPVGWREFLAYQGVGDIARDAAEALTLCRTERTAAILLDQYNGALEQAFANIACAAPDQKARLKQELLQWATFGLHLTQPWRVAFFGRPNVGKSSLLNTLAGFERAIVCDLPGTTRDVLGVTVAIDGWPVELLDGAGIHQTAHEIEAEGIRRYSDVLLTVDLRILVIDLSASNAHDQQELIEQYRPHLIVGNKADLAGSMEPPLGVDHSCSAMTGDGVEAMAARIVQMLVPQVPSPGAPVPFTAAQVKWLSP